MPKVILSTEELRRLDTKAVKAGFSERVLIENASSNMCCLIDSLNLGNKVLAAAGRGNNGADTLACARKLANRGYNVYAIVISDKEVNKECSFQADMLKRLGIHIGFVKDDYGLLRVKELLHKVDFVVDGILGIGVKKGVEGLLKNAIDIINAGGKKIVSCDVPSGLNPDTGAVTTSAIRAGYTVTFLSYKKGFFTGKGKNYCGKIYVADIGVSRELLEKLT
ncbi:MAG: NAD(P)H-hydrate epimerase [Candidatus Omnitrophica bacterium 4484_171]|nr:MAG: NAD(P)H-hydrate epimerase [Candidatus Omnitrophica bacterium 4484_171]